MRPALRIVAVAAVVAAFLSPASAQGASFFKRDSGGVRIEVHVVHRTIVYLTLVVPVTCDPGVADPRTEGEIAYGRMSIPTNPRSGAFSYAHYDSVQYETFRTAFHGTIRNGVVDGEYQYTSMYSPPGGDPGYCWSGDGLQGLPDARHGTPVQITVSRHEGLRFYQQDRGPDIYMWVGGGKVYGLTTAPIKLTCTGTAPLGPSSFEHPTPALGPLHPIAVNPITHRFAYRQLPPFYPFKVWGLVGRRVVRGTVSLSYDIENENTHVHCQTGGRDGPAVRFEARRG